MKKFLFLLATLFTAYSCSEKESPLGKSITNPLSIEEMKQIIETEPSFTDMYNGYLEGLKLSKLDTARFIDITYERLLDFYKMQDTIDAYGYTEKYNRIGKEYQERADDMVDSWIKYLDKNNINESDSLKLIYEDYEKIINERRNWHNDYARVSYVISRSFLITKVIDSDYSLMPSFWGMNMARKHLVKKDSLCNQLFLLTKRNKSFNDEFVKAMKSVE